MLNGIHLVDFGNHRDTRLTFGRMTALVGQNGAGKTGVLRAIGELSKAPQQDLRSYRTNGELARKRVHRWIITASWGGEYEGKEGDWALRLGSDHNNVWLWRNRPTGEDIWLPHPLFQRVGIRQWPPESWMSLLEDGYSDVPPIQPGEVVMPRSTEELNHWFSRYFKTAGSYLQGPSYSESVPPELGEDCRDLAWTIAYLKGYRDDAFDEIVRAWRDVVPVVRRVGHRPVSIRRLEKKEVVINKQTRSFDEEQQVMGQELRFDMASGKDLPATAISEGTLVTLAILTAVLQHAGGGPGTILLDDVESGLHPRAQRDLIKQLRKLQETRPELQIIFSTHSPYILDEMEPEDVWLLAPDAEGIAHAAKLSEHPDLDRARGVLTTGELWSAEGEDWVLDPARRARPAEAAEPAGASAN